MNQRCTFKRITDICKIERAVSGKIYKKGSVYIKLSAADESVLQIKEDSEIESRYAVFEPLEEIDTDYLKIAVESAFPDFLRRYRTTINLQFDTLNFFEIPWHEDKKMQQYVVNAFNVVNDEIQTISEQIEHEKQLKKWYLRKMFPEN